MILEKRNYRKPPSGREGDRSGVPKSEFTSFGGRALAVEGARVYKRKMLVLEWASIQKALGMSVI